MKVCGFTFIRNAEKFDFPIVEAITSILPICDHFVVAVGKSEDNTRQIIQKISPEKITIVDTEWDDSLKKGGAVYAAETNKAFDAVPADFDWCFYIQGDEVLHEKYLVEVQKSMFENLNKKEIDGLLFGFRHFYGTYDYVGDCRHWYRKEIRVIRNDKSIYSFRDAQGFRKEKEEKLRVKPIDACIYHYGWVKEPAAMQRKQENFNKYWHDDEWLEKNVVKAEEFDYNNNLSKLTRFKGTHPHVMQKRINAKNWKFDYDISFNRRTRKEQMKSFLKNHIGIDTSYRNYKII